MFKQVKMRKLFFAENLKILKILKNTQREKQGSDCSGKNKSIRCKWQAIKSQENQEKSIQYSGEYSGNVQCICFKYDQFINPHMIVIKVMTIL